MTEQSRIETGWLLFFVGLGVSVPGLFLLIEPLGLDLWKHFVVSLAVPAGLFFILLGAKHA